MTTLTEQQKNAIDTANTVLSMAIAAFEREENMDDFDYEMMADAAGMLQAEFPEVAFVHRLDDEPLDGPDLSDEEALTSAGRGTDESYGEMPL